MPRLELVPARAWSDSMKEATRLLVPPPGAYRPPAGTTGRRPTTQLDAFAINPELAQAFFAFNRHVLWETSLPPRWRHILIMRVAARRQCAFLWSEHLHQARDAGLVDVEIERIAGQPSAQLRVRVEEALSRAVDECIDAGSIVGTTWDTLAEQLEAEQLLDVIFTVGCYSTVAAFMLSVGLDVDSAAPRPPWER